LVLKKPPPPQTSFIEEQNFPPPPLDQGRGYGYQEVQDDFPPPPQSSTVYESHDVTSPIHVSTEYDQQTTTYLAWRKLVLPAELEKNQNKPTESIRCWHNYFLVDTQMGNFQNTISVDRLINTTVVRTVVKDHQRLIQDN
jgi:hypothetical protein